MIYGIRVIIYRLFYVISKSVIRIKVSDTVFSTPKWKYAHPYWWCCPEIIVRNGPNDGRLAETLGVKDTFCIIDFDRAATDYSYSE